MLKLVPNPIFKAQVKLTVPGQELPAQIEMSFRYKTPDELQAWLEDSKSKPFKEVLPPIITGWGSDVTDDNNLPVEYSEEQLATLLGNYRNAGGEIFDAYITALTESRVKN